MTSFKTKKRSQTGFIKFIWILFSLFKAQKNIYYFCRMKFLSVNDYFDKAYIIMNKVPYDVIQKEKKITKTLHIVFEHFKIIFFVL